jgi:hypothetical protein
MTTPRQTELIEMLHELAEHLGCALYSDEWRTREYAIVAFNQYKRLCPGQVASIEFYEQG